MYQMIHSFHPPRQHTPARWAIAFAVIAQSPVWKGWDGTPHPKATTIAPDNPSQDRSYVRPAPIPMQDQPTSMLVMRLSACRSRLCGLQQGLSRTIGYYRDPHCTAGRQALLGQSSRYLSLAKRQKHQINVLVAEIKSIESELERRGV